MEEQNILDLIISILENENEDIIDLIKIKEKFESTKSEKKMFNYLTDFSDYLEEYHSDIYDKYEDDIKDYFIILGLERFIY